MNLLPLKYASESIAILALAGCAVYATWDFHQTQIQARATIAAATPVLTSINSTLVAVNRPCAPGPCGTLAEINKSAVKVQDIAVTTQRQVAQSSALVSSASAAITRVSDQAATTLAALPPVAQQATATLGTMNHTIQKAQPILEAMPPVLAHLQSTEDQTTVDLADLNAILSDPSIRQTQASVAHMAATADAVETKATQSYLHPSHNPFKRIWDASSPFVVAGAKVTAAIF